MFIGKGRSEFIIMILSVTVQEMLFTWVLFHKGNLRAQLTWIILSSNYVNFHDSQVIVVCKLQIHFRALQASRMLMHGPQIWNLFCGMCQR